jgi:hypothetical protein
MENRMDELTHKVEITISGNYPHGTKQHSSVSISGDGGLDHMIEAFKAALIAAGFSIDTATTKARWLRRPTMLGTESRYGQKRKANAAQ